MDLPYCKICGERHRLGFCPEFGPMPTTRPVQQSGVERGKPLTDAQVRSTGEHRSALETGLAAPMAPQGSGEPRRADVATSYGSRRPHQIQRDILYVSKPKFDKRSYQRELMRKRRAEGKA